jgi:hypothetical protein
MDQVVAQALSVYARISGARSWRAGVETQPRPLPAQEIRVQAAAAE